MEGEVKEYEVVRRDGEKGGEEGWWLRWCEGGRKREVWRVGIEWGCGREQQWWCRWCEGGREEEW